MSRDAATGQDSIYAGLVASSSSNNSNSTLIRDPHKLFFGTQMCYIFLRLHHALYARLRTAKVLAHEMQQSKRASAAGGIGEDLMSEEIFANGSSNATPSSPRASSLPGTGAAMGSGALGGGLSGSNLYSHFLGQVYALVEGSMEQNRFEDFCRTTLGNKAYVLYTLDKIVGQLVKHLQAMANDENVNKLIGLFVYHHNQPRYSKSSSISDSTMWLFQNLFAH